MRAVYGVCVCGGRLYISGTSISFFFRERQRQRRYDRERVGYFLVPRVRYEKEKKRHSDLEKI